MCKKAREPTLASSLAKLLNSLFFGSRSQFKPRLAPGFPAKFLCLTKGFRVENHPLYDRHQQVETRFERQRPTINIY